MKRCIECRAAYAVTGKAFPIDEWLCRECQKSPAVQVRILLCRARVQGFDFERAWSFALGCAPGDEPDGGGGRVRWEHDTGHRLASKAAFMDPAVVEQWRAGYERRAPVRTEERALVALVA